MGKIFGDIAKTLSFRERLFLGGGGIFISFILIYFLVVSPIIDKTTTLDRLIIQKEKDIKEIAILRNDYNGLKKRISVIGKKLSSTKRDFSLLSFLEEVATKSNVRKNIAYIRPQNTTTVESYKIISVEVKIDNVTLKDIVDFLSFIEESPHLLKIKRVRLKTRYADPRYLNLTFLISTYEKI